MKSLTQSEVNTLLAKTQGQIRAMILLGFRHGMRVSEICGLARQDVNLENGTITIRRLKNSHKTTQTLSQEEKQSLQHIMEKNAVWRSQYVFLMRNGSKIRRETLSRWFKKLCLQNGISVDKAHPHVLKHSLAVVMVKANVSLPIIQRALGHKSIMSTQVYTQVGDDIASKAIEKVLG